MTNGLEMLDKLQEASITNDEKKEVKSKYCFDKLKMYFGEDFHYKGITISMPTVGDIMEIGEDEFYQSLSPFLYNSTSIRVMLWDNGIDWNKIKDIEVFHIMSQMSNININNNILNTIKNKKNNIFFRILYLFNKTKKENSPSKKTIHTVVFKNVNISDFNLISLKKNIDDENESLALYNKKQDILLYEDDFMIIAEYIREMLNVHPKVEKAKGKTAKTWMIQEDKMNMQTQSTKEKSSTLLSLISSCVNHPGFKYNAEQIKEVGIYQFMDSVKRIPKYENGTAAIKGCYSGMISPKDIPEDVLNFMGDI